MAFVEPYVPKIPNEGSRHQTPASLGIDVHYATLLITERWTWDRYARLCAFIQMTPWEIASLVMMPHKWIDQFKEQRTLPDRPAARPIALLLTILEAHLMSKYTSDVIADPFPNLTKTPDAFSKNP